MNIAQLRAAGYKVRVKHYRRFKNVPGEYTRTQYQNVFNGDYTKQIEPKGGRTVVELTLPTGEEVCGVAVCYYKDQFNRREGRIRALGKALHEEKQLTGSNAFKETAHA